MKRVLLGLFAVALIVISSSTGLTLQAAPLNQTTPAPSAGWGVGALLRVKASVPFSWLRSVPSVGGSVLDTAPRGDYLVVASASPAWDGVQWWWQVRRGSVLGWVEEGSLELVIAAPAPGPTNTPAPTVVVPTATPRPPDQPADWTIGTTLHLKAGVPFGWLRSAASPSGVVVDTARSNDLLTVVSAPPQADNLGQLWWLVRRTNGTAIGYLEQNSMEPFVPTPTPVPSSTPTPGAPTPTRVPSSAANWPLGAQVRVKLSVPFSWLRNAPSSGAGIVDTAVRGELLIVASASPLQDSLQQWWWLVRRSSGTAIGYVEQDSLEAVGAGPTATPVPGATSVPGATPAAQTWPVGSIRSIKASVPYVWVRTSPSSGAGVQLTLYPGWLVLVQNATPAWDGVQWWWQIWVPARNVVGWVEQNSLQ
jgi:hypothetical protein